MSNNLILDIYPTTWIAKYGGNVKIRQHDVKYGIIVARNIRVLVLKQPNGMYWSERGKQKYMPAIFQVYNILGETAHENFKVVEALNVEWVIDFSIPRKSRRSDDKTQLTWLEES